MDPITHFMTGAVLARTSFNRKAAYATRQTLGLFLCLSIFSCVSIGQSLSDLANKAEAAYRGKHYSESANLYVQVISKADELDRSPLEYNAACSFALAGEKDKAFLWLNQAIQDGSLDIKKTKDDSDFANLHTDPRWADALHQIEVLSSSEEKHWSAVALNTPYSTDLTDSQKVAGLSQLWAEARYGFANFWHVPDLDWDATYMAYLPQVTATKSTAEYYHVLTRFYALLQDGHTGVYEPEAISPARLPIRTRLIDGHVLVIGVRDPAFDLQGIHIGDELLAINGQPVIEYATQYVRPYVSASSPQDRDTRTYEYELLLAPIGTALTLEMQSATGLRSSHRFVISKGGTQHHSSFEFHMLPGNIAYVALNSFEDNSAALEFDKNFDAISKADSLILDLRENGGGSDNVGTHILSMLINEPVSSLRSVSPRYIATYRAWGMLETPMVYPKDLIPRDSKRHFHGKVIVLTSPRTFSAGEDFVVVFAQSHRGTIIGEPTGGSTGQPLMFKLPGGGLARVCTKHDSFADGKEFVGIGVKPEITAHLSITDVRSGRDRVLALAVHTIQIHH
jgi:carboxyl-terminal processing protease